VNYCQPFAVVGGGGENTAVVTRAGSDTVAVGTVVIPGVGVVTARRKTH